MYDSSSRGALEWVHSSAEQLSCSGSHAEYSLWHVRNIEEFTFLSSSGLGENILGINGQHNQVRFREDTGHPLNHGVPLRKAAQDHPSVR